MKRFEGKRAIVTGGASGIGLAISTALVNEGCEVVVLDLSKEVSDPRLTVFATNVSDRDSVTTAVNAAASHLGGIDIVVNSAGISSIGTVEENSDSDWARVLDVNVTGTARVCAASLPWLRESESATIVNICSVAALNGLPRRALYSASKGAVLSLTYAMATDHVREGIRVNCVNPGTVWTPFVDRFLKSFADPVAEKAALDARQATGRMVTTEEVAMAVLYLASPDSGSTTGVALDVDGGMTHLRVRQ